MREAFVEWLKQQGYTRNTQQTQLTQARRLEEYYGDLDVAFESDGFAEIRGELSYSKEDERAGRANPAKFDIDGNVYANLASYRATLTYYARFRTAQMEGNFGTINASWLLGLVEAGKLASMVFHKPNRNWVQRPPIATSIRTSCVVRTDAIEVNLEATRDLDRSVSAKLIQARAAIEAETGVNFDWTGTEAAETQKSVIRTYLTADPADKTDWPIQHAWVIKTIGALEDAVSRVLRIGPGPTQLDRSALEAMKKEFLNRFPGIEDLGFRAERGSYWEHVRRRKQALIQQAQEAAHDGALTPSEIGSGLLDILTSGDAVSSKLTHGGMAAHLKRLRQSHVGLLEQAVGEMIVNARSIDSPNEDVALAVEECVDQMWEVYRSDNPTNNAYSDTRTVPPTALALAMPAEAIAIRYQQFQTAGRRLLNRSLFKESPLTADEYRGALAMTQAIRNVMEVDWGWDPQDLWDVRAFILTTCGEPNAATDDEDQPAPMVSIHPLNLILYGPPGTGKTYATAEEAVRFCDGVIPATRGEIMERYRQLIARKRIAFVTFHQSYSYEDFVEGLRPDAGNQASDEGGASSGFSLRPHPGILKVMAELAGENRGPAQNPMSLDRARRVFKVALGRSGEEESDRLYRAAIDNSYVVLGWGGEIDWSPIEFDHFSAIKQRWQAEDPTATGKSGNIEQVFSFRSRMREGDLVIVSDGRDRFRAIGEIEGAYVFVPGDTTEYNHHRPVKWLWHDPKGLPRDVVYPRWFRSQSVYELDSNLVDWPSVEQVISGGTDVGEHRGQGEPYVLVIDEINRANISKVFGELITLIEPDKRLGTENALTVTLPYSGETFGVPSNLHIIGTMNTADRSIALLDTALRRRFQFKELMPQPDLLSSNVEGINLQAVLKSLNERIEYLFDREHQIGHAYFFGCASKAHVDDVMRTKIIPLLSEYFYENWEKVRQVLGETTDDGGFVSRRRIAAPAGSDTDFGSERWRYAVRATFDLAAYQQQFAA